MKTLEDESHSASNPPLPESEVRSAEGKFSRATKKRGWLDEYRFDIYSSFWRYEYESPFRYWKEEARVVGRAIYSEGSPGSAWAIPEDGRIGLTLCPAGLNIDRGVEANLLVFQRWQSFNSGFQKHKRRAFIVGDLDPWNDCL
jgi:hypothetical protein